MAAIRLDHPVLVSGGQIRRREFVTTRRGYDPDQVRQYLDELADQVDLMGSMIREARMEAEAAARVSPHPQADPYERLAVRLASVIREADETAERFRTEGRKEAEITLEEARREAARVRLEAQAAAELSRTEAERTLREARDRADNAMSGLTSRREAVVEQLARMQERLLGVARDLEAAIEPPAGAPSDDLATEADAGAAAVAEEIVDVRAGDEVSTAPDAGEEIHDGLADPSYEELWEGTETMHLEMPEIPPLDLSWGDEDSDRES